MLYVGLITRSNGEQEIISGTTFDLNLEFLALQMWSSFWNFVLLQVNICCLKLIIVFIIIFYHPKGLKLQHLYNSQKKYLAFFPLHMVDISVIKVIQFFFTLPAETKEIITWNKELNQVQNLCAKQPFSFLSFFSMKQCRYVVLKFLKLVFRPSFISESIKSGSASPRFRKMDKSYITDNYPNDR